MTNDHPDTSLPESQRSQRRFFRRRLFWIPVAIVVALIAIPFEFRRIRLGDIPAIPELVDREFEGSIPLEPEKNAYTHYREAAALLPPESEWVDIHNAPPALQSGRGWEVVSKPLRDSLQNSQAALVKWRQGTELNQAYCLELARADIFTELPVLDSLQYLSFLAVTNAARCLDEGKSEEAWEWLRAAFRCSRHVGQHGFLLERLRGAVIHHLAVRSIAGWASHGDVTAEQLRKALHEVRRDFTLTALNSTVLKAEYMQITNTISNSDLISDLLEQNEEEDGTSAEWTRIILFASGEPELSTYVIRHAFSNYLSQSDLQRHERSQTTEMLTLFQPTGREDPPLVDTTTLENVARHCVMAKSLIPAVANVILAFDSELPQQRAMELALLMEIHRRTHGEYADKLEELVPEYITEVPNDPLAKPYGDPLLLFHRTIDTAAQQNSISEEYQEAQVYKPGRIIYSRGRDGFDDGGALEDGEDLGVLLPDWIISKPMDE